MYLAERVPDNVLGVIRVVPNPANGARFLGRAKVTVAGPRQWPGAASPCRKDSINGLWTLHVGVGDRADGFHVR